MFRGGGLVHVTRQPVIFLTVWGLAEFCWPENNQATATRFATSSCGSAKNTSVHLRRFRNCCSLGKPSSLELKIFAMRRLLEFNCIQRLMPTETAFGNTNKAKDQVHQPTKARILWKSIFNWILHVLHRGGLAHVA